MMAGGKAAAAALSGCPWSSAVDYSRVLCLILFSLGLSPAAEARQLRFVTLVYRHGDRSPVKAYPKDPYQESSWPQGFGQLTQIGMWQHYELGEMLKQRYNELLNASYERRQIYIRSTDADRTLMSAEANLAGMFPAEGVQVFKPNFTWQPIPVHTVPLSEERLLRFPIMECKRYELLLDETKKSPKYVNVTRENLPLLKMVANETGLPGIPLNSVWSVYDTLFCEHVHNFTLPAWATPAVMEKLKQLKDFSFVYLFGIYKQEEKCRLQGGLFLKHMLKNLSEAANVSAPQDLKLIMYSAHDTTLVAIQMALNVYNGRQPPYASCHIFELHQEDNGSFTVEMFYRNESGKEPYPLRLPNCAQRCPLEDFIRITRSVVPNDWEKECQISKLSENTEMIIGLAVCSSLLFLLILLLLTIMCRSKTAAAGYHHVANEGEEHS
ncbi:lysosomal acid phosphatase [Latimeria chalumnae]|uniref:Lysosomal acid phosphatase n=1 Tax=Latimeria chalumnae TaxID=7897 RepID=H3BI67_LATCH|nr:PREDICTED: lysosomal acid phosphatase [Latimeria chalumnae]|eukprot:XP_005987003.1 PREDICTED: lysosomal acid phosphatase [Latimeria chalumnae]